MRCCPVQAADIAFFLLEAHQPMDLEDCRKRLIDGAVGGARCRSAYPYRDYGAE
jgi:hypothetical protein